MRACVVVNSRANYGRIKSFMAAADVHPRIELQVVVGASAVLPRFGDVRKIIERDGFTISAEMHSVLQGDEPVAMAKSAGLATIEVAGILQRLKPNVVIVVADRYEQISTAIASSYMNVPVAHLQGGELTGSIDDSVRHAITKLSHLHFPATEKSRELILRMGEDPAKVHVVGCPSIDLVASTSGKISSQALGSGVGGPVQDGRPFVLVSQHPVTTEYDRAYFQVDQTLEALKRYRDVSGYEVVWLWPNVDAGADMVSKRLREFRENEDSQGFHFFRNFSPEDYIRLMRSAKCIVGNSSSGIREASFLGLPAVNIGSRQNGRERAENVVDVSDNAQQIERAISAQVKRGYYQSSNLYGDGNAGSRMAEIITKSDSSISKKFYFVP